MYVTQTNAPLAMLDSDVEVSVKGPIAEVVVRQKFQNKGTQATEATYVFPLPHDAAVSAMWIVSGNRTIRASIEKRADAQRRYEAAVRAGVSAAVLDQERPDVFTQTVSAIPAKGTVTVTLRYDTVAYHRDGSWSLVLPLVVAPRYVPGTASSRPTTGTGRAPDTDRAPDASRVTPSGSPGAGGRTDVTIVFVDKVEQVASVSHDLKISTNVATLVDPKSDHDMIVTWRSSTTAQGWVEQSSDGGYAAVVVTAPAAPARKPGQKWVLALDRSAAAQGDADAVARPLVRQLLGAMVAADRVLVAGSDSIAWSPGADALRVLEDRWPQQAGAFDLTRVLHGLRSERSPVLLVTGGLVADDRAAVAAAKQLGAPVHVIGVGPAPARGLLAQIAHASGGTIRFALPGDDLAAIARAALADLAAPPAPLALTWGTLAATDVVPAVLPRLGAGQSALVIARVERAQTANVRTRGELFTIEPLPSSKPVDGATTTLGALGRRWARNRLDELLAASAAPDVVTAHALRYGLVSPYTSMVAIGTEVVVQGGVRRSTAIPVSVPAGMKWQAVKQQQVKVDTRRESPSPATTTTTKAPARDTAAKPVHEPLQPGASSPVAPPPRDDQADAGGERADEDDGSMAYDEELAVAAPVPTVDTGSTMSESVELISDARSQLRISPSLGVGVARYRVSSDGLLTLGTRVEYGRRSMLGFDAALWLVAGDEIDVQGRLLVSVARRGIARFVELGLGAGLHLGAGTGPAAAGTLRLHIPPRGRAAVYLRYDGAWLPDVDDDRRGQHAVTGGVEWAF